MAEFSMISGTDSNIPLNGTVTDENALDLTNPDAVLTGTNRGQQALGAPNIKTDSANQRIVVNDNTTNRVTFGKIGTGVNDWGLKVSKPTFNVDTATSDQLIFNSSQNILKVASVVIGSHTITSGELTGAVRISMSFAHGQTFKPFVLGSFVNTVDNVSRQLPYDYRNSATYFNNDSDGTGSHIASASVYIDNVDTTNINVFAYYYDINGLSWLAANTTLTFKFLCTQESIVSS